MKKILVLLIAGLMMMAQGAQAAPAEALFTTSRQDRILVFLNNRPVNQIPARKVYITGIPGVHRVQIRVYSPSGRLKFVHQDKILIRSNIRNHFILETHPFRGSRLISLSKPERLERKRVPSNGLRPIPHPAPQATLMSNEEFQQLMDHLSRIYRESSRVEVATHALRGRHLYAEDVKEIMQKFHLERNRLWFAKFAFPRVIDPEHFEVVFDALRYDESIFQLQDWMEKIH